MSAPFDTAALVGMAGTASLEVTPADTAIALGSGDLPVLATPRMVALMEAAACNAVAPSLPTEMTSVGTRVDVRHTAASPLGATVTATARVTDVSGSKVTFDVTATHRHGGATVEIGRGSHTRAVVDRASFLASIDRG